MRGHWDGEYIHTSLHHVTVLTVTVSQVLITIYMYLEITSIWGMYYYMYNNIPIL